MRLELSGIGRQYLRINKGDQIYNVLVTSHGLIIIFFALMPIIIGALGNY